MFDEKYNGDDGPGFDYEFHAHLLAGVHLMTDEQRTFFLNGWNACKEWMQQNEGNPNA